MNNKLSVILNGLHLEGIYNEICNNVDLPQQMVNEFYPYVIIFDTCFMPVPFIINDSGLTVLHTYRDAAAGSGI